MELLGLLELVQLPFDGRPDLADSANDGEDGDSSCNSVGLVVNRKANEGAQQQDEDEG